MQIKNQMLFAKINASNLALFRILFGLLMVVEMVRYYNRYIYVHCIKPTFHFHFFGFSFVEPLSPHGMYVVCAILIASAALVSVGLLFRISCWTFFFLYTYVFLIEKTAYNNHYYLICLLALLLANSSAHRMWSMDAFIRSRLAGVKDTSPHIAAWNLLMLQAQLVIVYFYAGVAKLNPDWLRGEPMRMWLADRATTHPFVAPFFQSWWACYFFSYGGLWLDLYAGFFLLWRKTRLFTCFFLLVFHLTNHFLFGIGIFPFLALAATVLFVEPETAHTLVNRIFKRSSSTTSTTEIQPPSVQPDESSSRSKSIVMICLSVYFFLQVVLPLRHWMYGGNVSWTEEGHNFSWHMKLRDKEATIPLYSILENGKRVEVNLKHHLTGKQISELSGDPDLIWEFAQFLRKDAIRRGVKDPIVTVSTLVSMNDRDLQPIIDEKVDLGNAPKHLFTHSPWIVPLAGQLRVFNPWLSNALVSLALIMLLGTGVTLFRGVLGTRRKFLIVTVAIIAAGILFSIFSISGNKFVSLCVALVGSLVLLSVVAVVVARSSGIKSDMAVKPAVSLILCAHTCVVLLMALILKIAETPYY